MTARYPEYYKQHSGVRINMGVRVVGVGKGGGGGGGGGALTISGQKYGSPCLGCMRSVLL